jgi:hypothetical protein
MLFEKVEMTDNLLLNNTEDPSMSYEDDQSQFFVEADAKPEPASSDEEEKVDIVDKCFMEMGGFGRLQKISYVMNTLAQGSAAFFLNCFVFLEKKPVYNCFQDGKWTVCQAEEYCETTDLDR